MILSLGVITIVAGLCLAWVYNITKEPIANADKAKQTEAIGDVLPKFDNNPAECKAEITIDGQANPFTVFPATENGQFVGAAVESYSMEGFSGEIKVMFGFNAAGDVTGYQVLQHAETPGLGAKMNEWFRMTVGKRSIIGVNPGTANATVAKDGGEIDGITAATISSRAFLGSLNNAYAAFEKYKSENVADK